ncbi:MAG: hypothetical protein BIFFINMI_01500 [Phycisphaerae bacterium]|nr:hypothetical protein [Phycisphaerae bacterium]
MIRLIEALGFRCLRYVRQPLGPFHVLVGPNASGKTTFLDVVAFLGQTISEGPEAAIRDRSQNLEDLVWSRAGDRFELAVEAAIPEDRRVLLPKQEFDTIRYEVRVGQDQKTGENGILEERVILKSWEEPKARALPLFPDPLLPPETLLSAGARSGARRVITKTYGGNDNYYSEVEKETGKSWYPAIKIGPRKSALGNLPEDEARFPVSTWLKGLLTEGVQRFVLNSLLIRKASPPGQRRGFHPDGGNLPWVISVLETPGNEGRMKEWVAHLRTALPDIQSIRTTERPDDRHRYLLVRYLGGLEVPSWMVSDGTLRMLGLTLPAYLPEFKGIYLIEEPENGVHPRAVETIFQSLSSVYDAQILLASHSPVVLNAAHVETVLCFKKNDDGATDIVRGSDHPALRNWKGEISLGTLLAGGVLG